MTGKLFYGSICVTDLMEKAKQGHSAFTRAANKKVYVNITVWENDEADKFGNVMSLQLQSSKEKKDDEKKFYIGNCKKSEGSKPLSETNNSDIQTFEDDLPF